MNYSDHRGGYEDLTYQDFAPAWYLGVNPDVQAVFGANYYRAAMYHWLQYGRSAGRRGVP